MRLNGPPRPTCAVMAALLGAGTREPAWAKSPG